MRTRVLADQNLIDLAFRLLTAFYNIFKFLYPTPADLYVHCASDWTSSLLLNFFTREIFSLHTADFYKLR